MVSLLLVSLFYSPISDRFRFEMPRFVWLSLVGFLKHFGLLCRDRLEYMTLSIRSRSEPYRPKQREKEPLKGPLLLMFPNQSWSTLRTTQSLTANKE
jgi:hypothetical protein